MMTEKIQALKNTLALKAIEVKMEKKEHIYPENLAKLIASAKDDSIGREFMNIAGDFVGRGFPNKELTQCYSDLFYDTEPKAA